MIIFEYADGIESSHSGTTPNYTKIKNYAKVGLAALQNSMLKVTLQS